MADNTGNVFPGIPVAATLSGFGTVNLARSGAAAQSNAVTITDTTFGTGVKALNLTNAGDLTTAAGVDITLASATSVSVANSAATKYTTVAVTDTATTVTTGSTLTTVSITGSSGNGTLTGNGITTVNLNAAATGGTVTVTAAAATRALTVNVSGTTNSGAVTDAQATTVTLNQTAAAVMGTLTVAKATTVSINTTGTATTAGAETLAAAAMTTLNIGGTRANTVTRSDYSALTSIVVTGTGGVTLGDLSGVTTLTSVNTSAATNVASATGAANLTVANTVQIGTLTSFTGGAGSDTVTVGATTKAINLGTGSNTVSLINGTTAIGTGGSITGDGNDTLAFATAADAATVSGGSAASITAFKAAVTGFSTLQLAAIAGSISIDVNNFAAAGTITQVNTTGIAAANTLTISNLGSGATIRVTGANTGAGTTTAGTTGSGTSDVLNLNLTQSSNAAVAFGTFTTPNVENINFIMGDTQATPVGYYNTATLTNTAAFAINVSGNSGLDLGTVTGATNLQTFNASGVTLGGVRVTSDALQYASTVTGSQKGGDTLNFAAALAAVTVTTTAGTNTVTGSNTVGSTFTGGTGADTFFGGNAADTINGGSGADIIYADNAGVKEVQTITMTHVADETDVLTVSGVDVSFVAGANTQSMVDNLVAAINANAALTNVVRAVATSATVATLTWTGNSDQLVSVDKTSVANTLTVATSTAGTTTGTANNIITGGAGNDVFVFGASSVAPSATVFQTINDFSSNADSVNYTINVLSIMQNATASAGTAAISANGIATFNINDTTLAQRIAATEAGINAGGAAAVGQMALFQFGSDAYAFISNGTDGVGAGDVLIRLVGVDTTATTFDQVVVSGHSFTLA